MLHKYPNVVPIPGSKNQERILENLAAWDVILTDEEFNDLDKALEQLPVQGFRGHVEFQGGTWQTGEKGNNTFINYNGGDTITYLPQIILSIVQISLHMYQVPDYMEFCSILCCKRFFWINMFRLCRISRQCLSNADTMCIAICKFPLKTAITEFLFL